MTDWADTTGSVFLGSRLGCAVPRSQIRSPLSQRDYYGLQAIFSGSKEVDLPLVNGMEIADFKRSTTHSGRRRGAHKVSPVRTESGRPKTHA